MRRHVSYRLPCDLLAEVEAYRRHIEARTLLTVNRTAVIAALVRRGLDASNAPPLSHHGEAPTGAPVPSDTPSPQRK